jgi:ADP-heptose:LPS heptosyltransferase
MNNNILIIIDAVVGILIIPFGLLLRYFTKLIFSLSASESKGVLLIKLLGAGNYLALKPQSRTKQFDIITVKSNLATLKHFGIGKNIYVLNDENIIFLALSALRLSITLPFKSYQQIINLEMESKFAMFLGLITPAKILSGISSQNKSFFDSLVYDKYIVSPYLINRTEITSQLIKFIPIKNKLIETLVSKHQLDFRRKYLPFKAYSNLAIFPSCSSTDSLRRLGNNYWRTLLEILLDNKKIKNISIVFSSKNDVQYKFFYNFLLKKNSEKINLKITNFCNFAETIKKSDLIISVDSQALHIAQLYRKTTIIFYGPTSPFGVNLENTTFPISNSLICSPCTHKYLKLPCGNKAPCLSLKYDDFEIFRNI